MKARCEALARRYARVAAPSLRPPPASTPDCASVWHLYVVRHARRDALQAALAQAGIGTLIHYPIAPQQQEAYAEMKRHGRQLPIAEAIPARC